MAGTADTTRSCPSIQPIRSPIGPPSDLFSRRFDTNLEPIDSVQFDTTGEDHGRAFLRQDAMYIAGLTEDALAVESFGSFDTLVAIIEGDLGFPRPSDLDGDGCVGGADLGMPLAARGPCAACGADLDQSSFIDAADLATMPGARGVCR